jgi:hypothetical protein
MRGVVLAGRILGKEAWHQGVWFDCDRLTIFHLFAMSATLLFFALESRCHWFIPVLAGACVLA